MPSGETLSASDREFYDRQEREERLLKLRGTSKWERPRIVCLCGSTRFWEKFRDEGLRLTLEGKIVLSIGICAPDSMVLANPESEDGKRQKEMLDRLHKHKIDLADEVLVLNVGGYIGKSTRSEINYARAVEKEIKFLESCPDYERLLSKKYSSDSMKFKTLMDHASDCDFCRACLGLPD